MTYARHKGQIPSDAAPRRSLEEPHLQRQRVGGGAGGWGRGWGVSVSWRQSFHLGRWNVLEMEGGGGYTTVCVCLMTPICMLRNRKNGKFYSRGNLRLREVMWLV